MPVNSPNCPNSSTYFVLRGWSAKGIIQDKTHPQLKFNGWARSECEKYIRHPLGITTRLEKGSDLRHDVELILTEISSRESPIPFNDLIVRPYLFRQASFFWHPNLYLKILY